MTSCWLFSSGVEYIAVVDLIVMTPSHKLSFPSFGDSSRFIFSTRNEKIAAIYQRSVIHGISSKVEF